MLARGGKDGFFSLGNERLGSATDYYLKKAPWKETITPTTGIRMSRSDVLYLPGQSAAAFSDFCNVLVSRRSVFQNKLPRTTTTGIVCKQT